MSMLPRELSPSERAIVQLVLAPDFDAAETLRAQVPAARVEAVCECGCPTIDLVVSDAPAAVAFSSPVAPVRLIVTTDGRETGAIVLFVHDGRLSRLEYFWFGEVQPVEWPDADRLLFEWIG
ncbi:MAG: hypothetical protein ACT4QF_07435 [Sporichthyaceae bacterium]